MKNEMQNSFLKLGSTFLIKQEGYLIVTLRLIWLNILIIDSTSTVNIPDNYAIHAITLY